MTKDSLSVWRKKLAGRAMYDAHQILLGNWQALESLQDQILSLRSLRAAAVEKPKRKARITGEH